MPERTAEHIAELSRDAAYVTIGLGVIAFQQAQVRRRAIQDELEKLADQRKVRLEGLRDNAGDASQALVDALGPVEEKVSSALAAAERLVRSVDLPDVKRLELGRPDLHLPEINLGEFSDKFGDVAKAGKQAAEDVYAHVLELVRRDHDAAGTVDTTETKPTETKPTETKPTETKPAATKTPGAATKAPRAGEASSAA